MFGVSFRLEGFLLVLTCSECRYSWWKASWELTTAAQRPGEPLTPENKTTHMLTTNESWNNYRNIKITQCRYTTSWWRHCDTSFKTTTETCTDLVGVVLRHVVKVQLKQEVVLLQSAEHAGKVAGQAVHPAVRRHADLTWLVAAEETRTNEQRRHHHVTGNKLILLLIEVLQTERRNINSQHKYASCELIFIV